LSYIGSTPANKLVTSSDMEDGIVTTAKIANDAATADKIANSVNSAITANTAKTGISSAQTSAITANTAKVTNANHSGEVTGATALTIAGNVVDEANLKVSNNPTNGYFLSAQSGNTGGMTWAAAAGGGKILQVAFNNTTAFLSTTSTSFVNFTSVAITPSATSSKILLFGSVGEPDQITGRMALFFFRNDTSLGGSNAGGRIVSEFGRGLANTGAETHRGTISQMMVDEPNSTSEITYRIKMHSQTGGVVRAGNGGSSNMIAIEIGA